MEIVVLVFGIVGFIMSFVIVGAAPAALALLLGTGRLLYKKKHLAKLGKTEIIIGMVFAALAVIVAVYMYLTGILEIDFVKIVRQEIKDFLNFFDRF